MIPVMFECPALALTAAPPSDRTATIANFDRISATSSSTARTAQIRRAGHTIAANASGSISTITYTAASRMSSSIHSANAAADHEQADEEREERRLGERAQPG